MKSRFCFAALAVVALVVSNSLRAADEPALKCPLTRAATPPGPTCLEDVSTF